MLKFEYPDSWGFYNETKLMNAGKRATENTINWLIKMNVINPLQIKIIKKLRITDLGSLVYCLYDMSLYNNLFTQWTSDNITFFFIFDDYIESLGNSKQQTIQNVFNEFSLFKKLWLTQHKQKNNMKLNNYWWNNAVCDLSIRCYNIFGKK